jgi:F0F1-type ATP synthase delta subunit
MNFVEAMVAKKYAMAVMAVFYDSLSLPIVERGASLALHMRTHTDILFFLRVSAINDDEKRAGLVSLIERYGLPNCMKQLIDLLLADKRTFLFAAILQTLYTLYLERQHIMSFTITSSHLLPESAVHSIQKFLACKTGNTIIYMCIVDPALIAGVRLANTTLFWEHSVARQLRDAQNILV